METEKIKIEFENGDIRTLNPVQINVPAMRRYFTANTGFIFDDTDDKMFWKMSKALRNWLIEHGLRHPYAQELIYAAECITAMSEMSNEYGFVAFTEEENECLIANLDPNRPYVWRISKLINDQILNRSITLNKRIVTVYLPQVEQDINYVHNLIQIAIDNDNFELAAIWRDNLIAYNQPD